MNKNYQNYLETEMNFNNGIGPIVKCNARWDILPSCFQILCFQIEKFREIAVCYDENVNKKHYVRLKIWLLKIVPTYLFTYLHMDTQQMFTSSAVIHINLFGLNYEIFIANREIPNRITGNLQCSKSGCSKLFTGNPCNSCGETICSVSGFKFLA